MGDAQIAQYLSAGVAGAPQRGQIMFTLLVKTERGPPEQRTRSAGSAGRGPGRRGQHTVLAWLRIKKKKRARFLRARPRGGRGGGSPYPPGRTRPRGRRERREAGQDCSRCADPRLAAARSLPTACLAADGGVLRHAAPGSIGARGGLRNALSPWRRERGRPCRRGRAGRRAARGGPHPARRPRSCRCAGCGAERRARPPR